MFHSYNIALNAQGGKEFALPRENAGAYFAAALIASIMLTALALPVPAMSKAVPWSTDVRKIGIPHGVHALDALGYAH